jgi:GntR family transcriptional repressor for pyruvate dehydrogenase complex
MDETLQPVEKQRVFESIVEQMRQMIVSGKWQTGQRLSSERELCEVLSVGRTSLREALRILEATGFIDTRAGDGIYVKKNIIIPQAVYNLFQMIQEEDRFADVMEARELIDAQVAYLAAENATEEQIAKLDNIMDRQAASVREGENGLEENIDLHLYLAEITGNRVILELESFFFKFSHHLIQHLFSLPGYPEKSLKEHREIVQSIKDSNPIKTHGLMLEHLRSRYNLLKEDEN